MRRHQLPKGVRSSALAAVAVLLQAASTHAAIPTDLSLKVTGASFKVGVQGAYTVTVTNRGGQATDAAVHVTTTLPTGLTFVSQSSCAWTCSAIGQLVDCVTQQSLSPGAASTFLLNVAICTSQRVVKTTFQLSYAADLNPKDNVATRAAIVRRGACVTPPPTPTSTPPETPPSPTPTLATPAPIQAAYYVSPAGDDNPPGTETQPFATLQRARDVIRTLNASMTGDIIVYLRGGTFTIQNTIEFGQVDSGTNGFNIRYVNYPGETPAISGGSKITGWALYDAASNIYQAPGVTFDFRQLYVNGQKAVRARTPNAGQWNSAINFLRDTKTITVNKTDINGWNDPSGVEMAVQNWWAESYLRLKSITSDAQYAYLTIQPEEESILFQRPYPGGPGNSIFEGAPYYFENAYAFIDAEAEWYRDAATNILYYKPRSNEDMATVEVIAPAVETLVSITGTLDNPVHNLWFSGLILEHSNWTRPSEHGQLDAQAFQYNVYADMSNVQKVGHPPAAVMVTAAHDIMLERNVFQFFGATGLDLVLGTHDDSIIGNVFKDIAGNGVSIGRFVIDENTDYHTPYNPSDSREICTDDTFANNYFIRIGTDYWGAIPIAGGYPRRVRIEHNDIEAAQYTAISVGYGWTPADNAMSGNIIRYNRIDGFMMMLWDGGGIYTLSKQPGTIIDGNLLANGSQDQGAIYFDNGSTGITACTNVVQHASRYVYLDGHDKYDCMFDDNYSDTRAKRFQGTSCIAANNHIITHGNWPPEAQSVIENAGLQAEYSDIRN